MTFDPNQPRDEDGKWVESATKRIGKMSNEPASTMTAGKINKQLDVLDEIGSKVTSALVAAGRGHQKMSEIYEQSDPLSRLARMESKRSHELNSEIRQRYGNSLRRLPTGKGFGPRETMQQAIERLTRLGLE